ncbi:MAG: NADH-ubiquinone oxidoreductase-F iron-sulfur binding region domain-containing protein, partial [Acidobacteriota bacterium]
SSLEGFRGHPRLKPPFPAVEGVYASPTVVNNVETLTAVPQIINMGGDAWRALGTEKSGGTKLWSVSGHINKPGVYELPMGYSDMEKFIMDDCGGIRGGKKLKACIPGGSSVYIMNAGQIIGKNVTLDYEGLVAAGSSVGSGGFIVMDETVDIMESTKNLTEFYKHESCGWCTPCREGTDWLVKIFDRISSGGGRPEDAKLMLDICDNIEGKSFCPLGDAAAWPIQSAIRQFPDDFKKWLTQKTSSNGVRPNV